MCWRWSGDVQQASRGLWFATEMEVFQAMERRTGTGWAARSDVTSPSGPRGVAGAWRTTSRSAVGRSCLPGLGAEVERPVYRRVYALTGHRLRIGVLLCSATARPPAISSAVLVQTYGLAPTACAG